MSTPPPISIIIHCDNNPEQFPSSIVLVLVNVPMPFSTLFRFLGLSLGLALTLGATAALPAAGDEKRIEFKFVIPGVETSGPYPIHGI
ncbi:MAG: hypothetical protein LBV28_02530, partial [Puniceicoccales bacterium]|nr:hypothetical protein [Puniceicoccales bacterium]